MVPHIELAPVKPTTVCKVCGAQASLYGVTDFNKNCEELRGTHLPLTGVPVYYHQCDACRLVFTEALDQWDKAAYLEHIYNDRYVDVDPDYVQVRPKENAAVVRAFLQQDLSTRHLDYGGGNGTMARVLKESGIDSSSWDPMDPEAVTPIGPFGLVTAFEVFEHTPSPLATLQEIVGFCETTTPLIFFTTYTIDQLPPRNMDFWYLAPRNGHITVYTRASLDALFAHVGFNVHHYDSGWHLAYREVPSWVDLQMFAKMKRRHGLHRLVVSLGLHRQGRLRRGMRRIAGG